MSFLKREKSDIIFDFKLFRVRVNTKKNYVVSNNKIVVVDENGKESLVESYPGITISFKANNSIVKIYKGTTFKGCNFTLRGDSEISILKSRYEIAGLNIRTENNTIIKIGENFSSIGVTLFSDNEQGKKIIIGNDCMFSAGISVRNSDGHRIYDVNSKEVLNYGEDIVIGNHVWVGPGVRILKGVNISDNTVIGANAIVNKKFTDKNIILAGMPARVVKSGVNWDRKPPGSDVPIQEYNKEIK